MNIFNNIVLIGSVIFFNVINSQGNIVVDYQKLKIKKVVLWGHKLHTHTHSYIHWGFARAFEHLGYDTYWFDNNNDVRTFDFSGSLFITEGQVDQKIPLREDCLYILHNCDEEKYSELLSKNQCILLQVYTHKCLSKNVIKIDNYIYGDIKRKELFMPWATDLLPHEIDIIKQKPLLNKKNNHIFYIGHVGGDTDQGTLPKINPFRMACVRNSVKFESFGGYSDIRCSMKDNIRLIQKSLMAPAIQCQWQVENGYIPCRIFKNISYGQFGITNSKTVYELFNKKIIYNSDTYKLFDVARKRLKTVTIGELHGLMDFVRDKHTYINRIKTIFDFFSEIKKN